MALKSPPTGGDRRGNSRRRRGDFFPSGPGVPGPSGTSLGGGFSSKPNPSLRGGDKKNNLFAAALQPKLKNPQFLGGDFYLFTKIKSPILGIFYQREKRKNKSKEKKILFFFFLFLILASFSSLCVLSYRRIVDWRGCKKCVLSYRR